MKIYSMNMGYVWKLKSDQNGIEIRMSVASGLAGIKVKIRPKWD